MMRTQICERIEEINPQLFLCQRASSCYIIFKKINYYWILSEVQFFKDDRVKYLINSTPLLINYHESITCFYLKGRRKFRFSDGFKLRYVVLLSVMAIFNSLTIIASFRCKKICDNQHVRNLSNQKMRAVSLIVPHYKLI